MTTPNTTSYRNLLANLLRDSEGIKHYLYLDSSGYLSTGMGLLLIDQHNAAQSTAFTSVRNVLNASDQVLFDAISARLTAAGNNVTLLSQDFLIQDGVLVRFRNGSTNPDSSVWTAINNLIPTDEAVVRASASLLAQKENLADEFVNLLRRNEGFANFSLNENQRAALVSRYYNGFREEGRDALITAFIQNNTVEIFRAFTISRSASGHISRSLDEFATFMGYHAVDKINATDNRVGYHFTDNNGQDVVIGYDLDGRGNPRAIFAYRYLPAEEGEPQRFEYFDPRSANSITQAMPWRMDDKISPVGSSMDDIVQQAVRAAGLSDAAAEAFADRLRTELQKNGKLLDEQGIELGIATYTVTDKKTREVTQHIALYNRKQQRLSLKLAENGDSEYQDVLANGDLQRLVTTPSADGDIVRTYQGADEEAAAVRLVGVTIDGIDIAGDRRYAINADGDVLRYPDGYGNPTLLTGDYKDYEMAYEALAGNDPGLSGLSLSDAETGVTLQTYYRLTLTNANGDQVVRTVTPIREGEQTTGSFIQETRMRDGVTLSSKRISLSTDAETGLSTRGKTKRPIARMANSKVAASIP
jgi:hypothetical protein